MENQNEGTTADADLVFKAVAPSVGCENRDIAEEQPRNLLAAIIESSGDAIISNTQEGIITSWNPGANRLFGYSSVEAVGKNISFLLPARQQEEEHILSHLRGGKRIEPFETVRARKDGKLVEISLTVSPVRNAHGQNTGSSMIAQDITHRKGVEAKLADYMQELEKSHEALSEYTHTVSHDLKAPLRRIIQYGELLQEETGDRLGAEATQHVARMVLQSKRMQRLVDDLLAYAQVLSVKEEKQETDLNKTLSEVTEGLESLLREYKATVNAGLLPVMCVFPLRIRQLFQNLIVNAIKYHNNRDPVITVESREEGDHWLFSFRDNGIGIAEEYHQSIFKAFERLHSQEEIEGTGLGLAICAKAAELHGGRIWVESKLGEGAVFYFTLRKKAKGAADYAADS